MSDTHGAQWEPEIAVDLDGTLAVYDGWQGLHHIGKPVPAMAKLVKHWIKEGKKVVIFTSRVSDPSEKAIAIPYIQCWLMDNGFGLLDITATKRKQFIEFWDDRAVRVQRNTGRVVKYES